MNLDKILKLIPYIIGLIFIMIIVAFFLIEKDDDEPGVEKDVSRITQSNGKTMPINSVTGRPIEFTNEKADVVSAKDFEKLKNDNQLSPVSAADLIKSNKNVNLVGGQQIVEKK